MIPPPSHQVRWVLRLYVMDGKASSRAAMANLQMICRERLEDNCDVTVIDIKAHPGQAFQDQIVCTPTLVLEAAGQLLRLVGDLSDSERVLSGLGIS